MLIKKTVPDKRIIELLGKEIKEFALPLLKEEKDSVHTKAVFDKLKIPKIGNDIEKIVFPTGTYQMARKADSPEVNEVLSILKADECTNTLYYKKNGCMPWHTNSDNPGKRIYIVFTTKPGIFRYKNPYTGEIVDDYDYVGWTQREFIVDIQNLLWHAVWSPAPRFAYGFNIKNVTSL